LINDDVGEEGRGNGFPQFPQNFAVSMFWLRQTGQINICILQYLSKYFQGSINRMKLAHTIMLSKHFVNGIDCRTLPGGKIISLLPPRIES
jgi:hypothetical protein